MKKQVRVFTSQELASVRCSSLTWYIAHELRKLGAPIEFNPLNLDLSPDEIKITGYLRDRIKMDGSHEFVFEPKDELLTEGEE